MTSEVPLNPDPQYTEIQHSSLFLRRNTSCEMEDRENVNL